MTLSSNNASWNIWLHASWESLSLVIILMFRSHRFSVCWREIWKKSEQHTHFIIYWWHFKPGLSLSLICLPRLDVVSVFLTYSRRQYDSPSLRYISFSFRNLMWSVLLNSSLPFLLASQHLQSIFVYLFLNHITEINHQTFSNRLPLQHISLSSAVPLTFSPSLQHFNIFLLTLPSNIS